MGYTVRVRYPPGEARMGRMMKSVVIQGFVDPAKEVACEALVDTGAYCLTLPATWKDRLGPLPVCSRIDLETADHRVVQGEVAGPVTIRIDGFRSIVGEVLFMPVEPGHRPFEPLLGYLTLEQAGIVVDMVGHRLVRVPYFDLKRSAAA